MWQRQTQRSASSGAKLRIAAGCGSWTTIASQCPSISRRVGLVVAQVLGALGLAQLDLHPLQAVMNPLGDLEEAGVAGDHPPLGLDAEVALERDERGE